MPDSCYINEVHNTIAEAVTRLQDYYREYHPAGYGTTGVIYPVLEEHSNAITGWRVVVSRYPSCD